MADDELNELLDQLETQIADERRDGRARQGKPRSHPGEPQADARGRSRPGRRARPAARPGQEARRDDDRDRRVRHGQPGQVVGARTPSWARTSSRSARRTARPSPGPPSAGSTTHAGRPGLEGAKLVVVDTPGIDEVGGEVREALARDVARHADLILFVVSGDMQRIEIEALTELREAQKPIILVFNQIDRYPEVDRDQIYAKIKDERVKHLVRPDDIVMTAARPDAYKVKIQLPDGTTQIQWERPAPLIEPLKVRILDVLEREGKALVALNTLLIAGDLHAEIVARKVRIRDDAANRLIWNFALATGAAVALNPIPVVDIAGGLAVDVGMIVALSQGLRHSAHPPHGRQPGPRHDAGPGRDGRRRRRQPARRQRHQVVAGRRDDPDRRPGRAADRARLRRHSAWPRPRPPPRRRMSSAKGPRPTSARAASGARAASRPSSSRSSPRPRPTRSSTGCATTSRSGSRSDRFDRSIQDAAIVTNSLADRLPRRARPDRRPGL